MIRFWTVMVLAARRSRENRPDEGRLKIARRRVACQQQAADATPTGKDRIGGVSRERISRDDAETVLRPAGHPFDSSDVSGRLHGSLRIAAACWSRAAALAQDRVVDLYRRDAACLNHGTARRLLSGGANRTNIVRDGHAMVPDKHCDHPNFFRTSTRRLRK